MTQPNIFLFLICCLLFQACYPKKKESVNVNQNEINAEHTTDSLYPLVKRDHLPNVLLPDVEFNTVAKWFYGKNTTTDNDGTIIGLYNIEDLDGEYWDEKYVKMLPYFTTNYTEDGKQKTAVMFEGPYFYMHGHTHSIIDALFFEKINDQWKFIDSLRLEEADIGTTEESNLCKKGFSIRVTSEWANMGAVSSSEAYYAFQHEELVVSQYFWTYSGRFSEEEPYGMMDEDSARVMIKENLNSDWNSIYYYGTKYGCSQKDAEDNLSYCSAKYIYENGKYQAYPLGKSEKPK